MKGYKGVGAKKMAKRMSYVHPPNTSWVVYGTFKSSSIQQYIVPWVADGPTRRLQLLFASIFAVYFVAALLDLIKAFVELKWA